MELVFALITVILGTTVFVRLRRDITAITISHRRNKVLLAIAKKRANKPFSIIVSLARKADTLFPLLDNLRQQHYPLLQVVIITKQMAGKNAKRDIALYAKQNDMNIVVITHRANMTMMDVAEKYATGTYIVGMEPHERFSKNSLSNICLEFSAAPKVDGLRIRGVYQLEATILSGLIALAQLSNKEPSLYAAYLRRSLKKNSLHIQNSALAEIILPARTVSQSYRLALLHFARQMYFMRAVLYIILSILFITAFILIDDSMSRLVVASIALICIFFNTLLQVIENYRYKTSEVISLALLAPVSLLFGVFTALAKLFTLQRR